MVNDSLLWKKIIRVHVSHIKKELFHYFSNKVQNQHNNTLWQDKKAFFLGGGGLSLYTPNLSKKKKKIK